MTNYSEKSGGSSREILSLSNPEPVEGWRIGARFRAKSRNRPLNSTVDLNVSRSVRPFDKLRVSRMHHPSTGSGFVATNGTTVYELTFEFTFRREKSEAV